MVAKLSCRDVCRKLSDYLDGEGTLAVRARIEEHLRECGPCRAVLEGLRNVVQLAGDERAVPLPAGFSDRLRQRIADQAATLPSRPDPEQVPLGIRNQYASLGDHIAYFWETDAQFEEAVNFLVAGLKADDHCFVFGHDQANQRVLQVLRRKGCDVENLQETGRLHVVAGGPSGDGLLADLGARFQDALAAGAPVIRLLGNLGWGFQNWPQDNDILTLEAKVTDAARQFPCVIVCLYDVCTLPGRILLRGGFETHPSTVRSSLLRENPHYVPTPEFLRQLNTDTGYLS